MVALLAGELAEAIDLGTHAKQAHWKVKGSCVENNSLSVKATSCRTLRAKTYGFTGTERLIGDTCFLEIV